MPVTPLDPPLRKNGPADFADKGDIFMAALPGFAEELTALEVNVIAKEASAVASAATAVGSALTAAAAANFKGNWASLTGALAMPASVAYGGRFWALNTALANVTTATPGMSASWTAIQTNIAVATYANRANLRALSPFDGDQYIVDGLGLFRWVPGSTELDDDESTFATAFGVWEMAAAAPEFLADYLAYNIGELTLVGTFSMSLTSLWASASVSFTVTVAGAQVGDGVLVTPGNSFGSVTLYQSVLHHAAYVSEANTVTVSIRNASAATVGITPSTWTVHVINH